MDYDYYEEFSEKAADRVKTQIKQRDELERTLEVAQKNLSTERAGISKLRGRIERLKALSGDSLTDSDLDFAKFKTSLKKLNSELEVSESACDMLQKEIIPKKNTALRTVRERIKIMLKSYFLECKPVNDERVRQKIDIAASEKKSFYDAFQKILQDLGLGYQGFAAYDRELHSETDTAYGAFWVSPRLRLPKLTPTPKQKPEPTPAPVQEQPESKTFLTGEPVPVNEPAEPVAPTVEPEEAQDEQPSESVVSAQ